uniref:Uncharacterized protein n=1 Tax=Moniliophthora roreri TaxID=221103 RepID=A0A0W0G1B0_MONRR
MRGIIRLGSVSSSGAAKPTAHRVFFFLDGFGDSDASVMSWFATGSYWKQGEVGGSA